MPKNIYVQTIKDEVDNFYKVSYERNEPGFYRLDSNSELSIDLGENVSYTQLIEYERNLLKFYDSNYTESEGNLTADEMERLKEIKIFKNKKQDSIRLSNSLIDLIGILKFDGSEFKGYIDDKDKYVPLLVNSTFEIDFPNTSFFYNIEGSDNSNKRITIGNQFLEEGNIYRDNVISIPKKFYISNLDNVYSYPIRKYSKDFIFDLDRKKIIFEPYKNNKYIVYLRKNLFQQFIDFSNHTNYTSNFKNTSNLYNNYIIYDFNTYFTFYGINYTKMYIFKKGYISFTNGNLYQNINLSNLNERIISFFGDNLELTYLSKIYIGKGNQNEIIITFKKIGKIKSNIFVNIQVILCDNEFIRVENGISQEYNSKGNIVMSYSLDYYNHHGSKFIERDFNNIELYNIKLSITPLIGLTNNLYFNNNFSEINYNSLLDLYKDYNINSGVGMPKFIGRLFIYNNNTNERLKSLELSDINLINETDPNIIYVKDKYLKSIYNPNISETNKYKLNFYTKIYEISINDTFKNQSDLSYGIVISSQFDSELRNNELKKYLISDSTNNLIQQADNYTTSSIDLPSLLASLDTSKLINFKSVFTDNTNQFNEYGSNIYSTNQFYDSKIYKIELGYFTKFYNTELEDDTSINDKLLIKITFSLRTDIYPYNTSFIKSENLGPFETIIFTSLKFSSPIPLYIIANTSIYYNFKVDTINTYKISLEKYGNLVSSNREDTNLAALSFNIYDSTDLNNIVTPNSEVSGVKEYSFNIERTYYINLTSNINVKLFMVKIEKIELLF